LGSSAFPAKARSPRAKREAVGWAEYRDVWPSEFEGHFHVPAITDYPSPDADGNVGHADLLKKPISAEGLEWCLTRLDNENIDWGLVEADASGLDELRANLPREPEAT